MESLRPPRMSVAEYFAFEEATATCHEYLGGLVREKEDSSRDHNVIMGNLAASLHTGLRGSRGRVFLANFKVRLDGARDEIFYCPDVVVSNHPESIEKYFLPQPTLAVEVFSPATEDIDRHEKLSNYLQVPSMEEYVLVARDRREVTIFRRATGWQGETYTAPEAVVEFRSVKQSMTVAEIYEDMF